MASGCGTLSASVPDDTHPHTIVIDRCCTCDATTAVATDGQPMGRTPTSSSRVSISARQPGLIRQQTNPKLPAWATTPVPSPVTDKPADHEVRVSYGVPSSLRVLRRRNPKFCLPDRPFRASTRTQQRSPVNDAGSRGDYLANGVSGGFH